MGAPQCLLIVLLAAVRTALSFPATEFSQSEPGDDGGCPSCPAGTYQSSCTECTPCPAGSYTAGLNQDDRCERCSGDCRPDFHLKVVENCTRTSNVRCVCEDGFRCTDMVPLSDNCRYCEKIRETTTAAAPTVAAAAVASGEATPPFPSPTSPQHSSTSSKSSCLFPRCATPSVTPPENATHFKTGKNLPQAAIVACLLVALGTAALVTLFSICRPANKLSFKQALLLCTKGGRASSLQSREATHQAPRDSSGDKQPPSSPLSAANLGPVHFHNPGTVIFSLLSQFTGQVGPTTTVEAERKTEAETETDKYRVEEEEEEERDCPVFHPTSSPSVRLSEEERSAESDSIFFPCQEQGKDYHMSKQEAL